MKLKHYLILSYLLTLLAPVLCAAVLFKVNKEYNYRTEVKDYLNTILEFSKYEEIVSNPKLYTGDNTSIELQEFKRTKDDNNVIINLYNNKGITVYSSTDDEYMVAQEYLYQNLNEIQYGGTSYTLKKPVFNNDSVIVGFYEISIARSKLQQSINNNTIFSISIFIVFMLLWFMFMLKRLNKRFNKPLRQVIQGMNDYAKGDTNVHIDYEANDEIGELCNHFNVMKDEIEENKQAVQEEQKAKEYMIATISHDLKTPLTSIRAYAELIKLEEDINKQKEEEYLGTILGKCDYMRDMLDDLLTYNLLSMNYKLSIVEVEGQEFCEMLFSGIDATCKAKHITLHTDIRVTGTYKVDVKYMTRVIDNIVSNAIRYTPEGGNIWVGSFSTDVKLPECLEGICSYEIMQHPEHGMYLMVKNEGTVISEKDRKNLFKPFYQGDQARSKKEHKGVGLGLSISKMIIEKHGGDIEAIPIPGVGNVMVCFLKSTSNKEGN